MVSIASYVYHFFLTSTKSNVYLETEETKVNKVALKGQCNLRQLGMSISDSIINCNTVLQFQFGVFYQ